MFQLHPDNPKRFLFRGKPAVLVTSGEHYGAVLNLDFDYRSYLEELAEHGLNHTRVFSGVYRELTGSFGITNNTLSPAAGRWACPWARTDVVGAADGGSKFDLRSYDPGYFERLKDFLVVAGRLGVVAEYNLFCPFYEDALWDWCPMNARNNVNGVGGCSRNRVYTLEEPELTEVQESLVRRIVAELNGFDNIYYEVCNEPYAGVVTPSWQDRIAAVITDTEAGLPNRHLISFNVANGGTRVEPNPLVGLYNFHYSVLSEVVALNADLPIAIGENETGFRGHDDAVYRTEGWDFMLSGGALYNNLDYSFSAAHPRGTLTEYESPGGGSRALRSQLGILKAFLERFALDRAVPADAAVRGGVPPSYAARCLAESGRDYGIYLHGPLVRDPDQKQQWPGYPLMRLMAGQPPVEAALEIDLPGGDWRLEWLDPETGTRLSELAFKHDTGSKTLRSPSFTTDIALWIRRGS
jgi:hypothetical protein